MSTESNYNNEAPMGSSSKTKSLVSKGVDEKSKKMESSSHSEKKASQPILRKKVSKSRSDKK